MKTFWQLLSLLISLTGFFIVGVISLINEESLFVLATRSIGVFVVLWVIHRAMGEVFNFVATQRRDTEAAEGRE